MSCHHQTALVEWIPLHDMLEPIYSVYLTDNAIELHLGCEIRENSRLVCTQNSYENAYEFCQILSEEMNLSIQDFEANKH